MVPLLIEKARARKRKEESNRTKYHWQSAAPLGNSFSKPKLKTLKKKTQGKAEIPMHHKANSGLSYSVKYFGVSFGEIGVLSKRLPIPKITYVEKTRPFTAQEIQEEASWAPNTEEADIDLIHTYARPRLLVSGKKKQMTEDDWNEKLNPNFIEVKERFTRAQQPILKTPINRTGVSGWKLTKPKSSVYFKPKEFTAKERNMDFNNEPTTNKQMKNIEFYNEPYLQYLAEIKGLNIQRNKN